MPIGSNSTSTSPTRFNDNNSNSNVNGASDRKNSLDSNSSSGSGGGGKLATMSYDPTSYIQRARVTRPAPPKPSCNPMQFVQIKPCNLYQTAQEQLKKAEEVKKVKEIKKEEPEDWQSNLDNWKSSRRKRVEHIIDRVVEVKKLELEEHDRTRRKSKTFSEMLEERSSRRTKLASLSVYTEDESNDLSDFGIGTSSTSGKSSLSEDYDNHSVMSDNVDTEKSTSDLLINHHHHHHHHHHNHHHHHQHDNNDQLNHDENGMSTNRDYISSPGYETSSSTAPTNSPDPCEYTYEGAIQDYKTRISRAQSNNNNNNNTNNGFNRSTVSSPYSKDSTPERNMTETNNYTLSTTKRLSGTKIENRLTNFELKSSSSSSATSTNDLSVPKKDLPKVDILKRRELFEKENSNNASTESISSVSNNQKRLSGDFTTTKSIRERLSNLEKRPTIEQESKQKTNRLSGDITSLKDRLQNLERQTSVTEKNPKIDVPVVPLKDRLSSLQSAVQKEEIKKPVLLVDEHQLEILKKEELEKQHILRKEMLDDDNLSSSQEILNLQDESNVDTDREDSGIHTTDVSCSVSQTDEQPDLVNEESHHHINAEDGLCQNIDRQLQNTSENHDKCEESAPCVPDVIRNSTNEPMSPNKLIDDQQQQQQQQSPDDQNINTTSPEPLVDQEASVEEALEIALRAIDNENFHDNDDQSCTTKVNNLKIYQNDINDEDKIIDDMKTNEKCTTKNIIKNLHNSKENFEPIYENLNEMIIIGNSKIEQNVIESSSSPSSTTSSPSTSSSSSSTTTDMSKNQIHLEEQQIIQTRNQNVKIYSDDHQRDYVNQNGNVVKHANHEAKIEELKSEVEQKEKENKENYVDNEPYYQVPKSSEPLYEVPKYQKPVPVYENIEIFYSDLTTIVNGNTNNGIDNEENQIEIENYHQLNGLVTTSSTSTSSLSSSSSSMLLQPPKEKPPPPPIEEISDNENEIESLTQSKTASSSLSTSSLSPIKQDNTNQQQQSLNNLKITEESINIVENVGNKQNPVKRMNSTKRIKKELRNKRSSFLGIEGNDDDIFLELTVAPPPDMAQLLQEERRLEKQLYMKAGLYDSSDTGESRDSGVSENHSRQSSEPFTNSSEEHEDLLVKKEKEIIEVLEKEEKKQRISSENWSKQEENDAKIQCIENQIREQEEVLRVERELLQLEQEELKRQRENLMIRENMARRELEHGAKMLMSATTNHNRSLQDINNASSSTTTTTATTNHYANIPNQIYRVEADYRKSMSDLPSDLLFNSKRIPPTPPAKPLRSNLSIDSRILNANGNTNNNNKNNNTTVGLIKIANVSNNQMITGSSGRIQHSQSTDEFVPLRNYQPSSALHHGNMTRHTLHALSATPKPKYTDGWVQATIKNKSSDKCVDNWLSYQQKRKSIPDGFNYNKHWLIQEAEQRRIDQQRGLRSSSISISTNSINGWANTNGNSAIQRNGNITNDKPLPDAVIQTITQRVQSKGLGERKRLDQTPPTPPLPAMAASDSLLTTVTAPPPPPPPPVPASATTEVGQQDKILSVSGKKKCSHCGEELGRGAAMIIESLRLFYHINCFKCCVCHVQLGDGLNGTDVRVRNHKLHCHNCYSSDDGIKFSCV